MNINEIHKNYKNSVVLFYLSNPWWHHDKYYINVPGMVQQ